MQAIYIPSFQPRGEPQYIQKRNEPIFKFNDHVTS